MKKNVFEVRNRPRPSFFQGIDRLEFLLSPNVGEEPKPPGQNCLGGGIVQDHAGDEENPRKVGGRQVLVFDEVIPASAGHGRGVEGS